VYSCFDVCWSFGVAGWGGIRVPTCHTDTTPTSHTETRTHNQCCDTIEKSQAPDNGYINVRKMLSREEEK